MATPSTSTSLLWMPDEILRLVFANLTGKVYLARLSRTCRRLLPFALERLYASPYIFTLRTHKLIARTFKARPDLQDLVKSVTASESYRLEVIDKDDPTRRRTKRFALGADTLRESLRLPACEYLALNEIKTKTLHGILSAPSASALARVKVLVLSIRSSEAGDDEHAALWSDLAQLPALEELRLDGGGLASPGPQPRLASVRRLTLGVDLPPPFHAPFSDTFPELRHLTLEYLVDFDFVEHVLSTGPLCLESLEFDCGSSSEILATHLSRFTELSDLHLTIHLGSPSLMQTLSCSRIGRIQLEYGCTGVDEFLTGILRGPTRMKCLSEIRLDHATSSAGDELFEALLEDNHLRPPHEVVINKDDIMVSLYPEWPEGSSAEGLSRALELARQASVKVSGSALACLNWERDFEEQFKRFLVQRSIDTEDYGALERHYGREEAGEAIVRFHPDLADLVLEAARRKEEKGMAEA